MPSCAREELRIQFETWLKKRYSPEALALVDRDLEAQLWVAEAGEFKAGTGLCVFAKCKLCGQNPKVLEDGRISMLQGEPFCQVAPQPALVMVTEFNK